MQPVAPSKNSLFGSLCYVAELSGAILSRSRNEKKQLGFPNTSLRSHFADLFSSLISRGIEYSPHSMEDAVRLFSSILFLVLFACSCLAVGIAFPIHVQSLSILVKVLILLSPVLLLFLACRWLYWVNSEITEVEEALQRYSRGFFARSMPLTRSIIFPRLIRCLERLRQRSQKEFRYLRESHRQSEATIRSMDVGLLIMNVEKRIISLNPAASRLLHVHEELLQGKSVRILGELGSFLFRAEGGEEPREFRIQRPGSGDQWLRVKVVSLRDDLRANQGALVELSDVSEQKRFERTRQDFVANVSHELKTPITSIQGYIETLLDGGDHSEEDRRAFLQIIGRQSARLSSIVGELLTLARLETEQSVDPSTLSDVSLTELFTTVKEACASAASARDVIVHTLCESNLHARMNRWLIEQALINLVDNAIKYGSPSSLVRLVAHRESSSIILSVVDEGPGIPSEHLPRLFERFYRVDKARSRNAGGSGLGLSIVKHIAAVHGGRVLVESETGKGSTFSIVLPLSETSQKFSHPRAISAFPLSQERQVRSSQTANSTQFGNLAVGQEDALQHQAILSK